MINEAVLKATLLGIIHTNKKLATTIGMALSEVAAVRESIRGLDPTFSEVLAKHQDHYRATTHQANLGVLEGYDELSALVNDSLIA